MVKQVELKLLPEEAQDNELVIERASRRAGWPKADISHWRLLRRSVDARGKQPMIVLKLELYRWQLPEAEAPLLEGLWPVFDKEKVIIIGAGPAGYFAALELIALGYKPVIFERGKDVRLRRRDLRAIQQFGKVNPHSNYCFGEGGAGTYSDGKLYTRSQKRGSISKVLGLLVEHGAVSDILVDAHPHIGSNKLPGIVANLRASIEKYGGEVHFDSWMTDLLVKDNGIAGVRINGEGEHLARAVILATGHSARDIYYLLERHNIRLEPKPFALGVRIEHAQTLIDSIQYGQCPRSEYLPAASYRLASQIDGRGVFSFCMCPGGLVVPAATAPGEIVVNGMSLSRRDSAYANSGIVVAVEEEDLKAFREQGVFAGLAYQKTVEQRMFQASDGSQRAPAQRMVDFVEGRLSATLPDSSYIPGLISKELDQLLPADITRRLQKAMLAFGRKLPGYFTNEAVVIGVESRTSAPIRIPRDPTHHMHPGVNGLFPCGEGAGFAGGIISAAMDGQRMARAVSKYLN